MTAKAKSQDSFSETLKAFKEAYCDENKMIADILIRNFRPLIKNPVVDVGAGTGDIAASALDEFDVILLDPNDFPSPKNARHKRILGNFLDFQSDNHPLGTILFCHVLQYLDSDPERLRSKIRDLSPQRVITVENDNTNEFGELIRWSMNEIPGTNPELPVKLFSNEAILLKVIPFTATLTCPTFGVLATHFVRILLDAPHSPSVVEKMERKLGEMLPHPTIKIDQKVYCYERPQD